MRIVAPGLAFAIASLSTENGRSRVPSATSLSHGRATKSVSFASLGGAGNDTASHELSCPAQPATPHASASAHHHHERIEDLDPVSPSQSQHRDGIDVEHGAYSGRQPLDDPRDVR